MNTFQEKTFIQEIKDPLFKQYGISLFIKREDLIHQHISGNKWHKLKYNIEAAKKQDKQTILTFGGAYSNHIAATAYAGKIFNFKTIGIIRGENIPHLNPTLTFAHDCGMQLEFISRTDYKEKNESHFIEKLEQKFGDFFLIPEGGNNILAVKGCSEMLEEVKNDYDYYSVSCGTGTTIAGMSICLDEKKEILGFSALKGGDFLRQDIKNCLLDYNNLFDSNHKGLNFDIKTDYHFGGYAKINSELFEFVKTFKENFNIQLDYIYTGKMMFGIYDLIKKRYFNEGSKILAVHTGGIQGNDGIEIRFKEKLQLF